LAQEEDRPCSLCGISPSTIRELRSIISSQDDERIRELTKQVEEQAREIAELKQRLSHYENSNSPPLKNSLLYREMKSRRREEARANWEGAAKNDGRPCFAPEEAGKQTGEFHLVHNWKSRRH
jgi:hypothetical protein